MYQEQEMGPASECAFVIDDTSQSRAGRKVEGTSCYFDHTQGRHRKGHQVLQLGLAGSKAQYPYPWWAPESPVEVFWGQVNEEAQIVPIENCIFAAAQPRGREVIKSQLSDQRRWSRNFWNASHKQP